ncbi:alpha-galactosidase [Mariniluteicoccus flavus]
MGSGPTPTRFVHLRGGGVSVVVDLRDGAAPAVLHWGAGLGALDLATIEAMARGLDEPLVQNGPDAPIRLALVPEAAYAWPGLPGLSGSREGRDWSPRFRNGRVRVGGDVVDDALVDLPDGGDVEIVADDDVLGLGLVIALGLDASGLVRLRATVTNRGREAYALGDLNLALPVPRRPGEVLDLAGAGTHERVPQRHAMTDGRWVREGRRGRTGADAATVLHLGVPGFDFAHGEVWAVHVGWSGNHRHYAERVWTGQQVIGGGEVLLPGEVRLAPGEAYATPWLFASWGHGLDAVAGRFHRWLRSRDHHPRRPRPVTLNVWEAVYFDHSLERLSALADAAARVGVERFVLDDGWFGARRHDEAGLGDWVVSPEVWPDGLGPLIDHVTGLGLEFGLWIEPEMVNLDSDVARAHPEWVMQTGGRLPVDHRFQQVLNLAVEDCYVHVRDQLVALLEAHPIAYLKWDHNRDLVDAGTAPGGEPGVHAQTLAAYRLMAELKERRPGLEIESCASGGGRVDLGAMELCDRIWVSDNIDPHERQQIHRWTTQLLPWELMGCHVPSSPSHVTHRTSTLDFRCQTAIFGHLGVEWDLTACDDDELDRLAAWIAWHKDHRALFHSDTIRRVDAQRGVVVHGVVAADRSRAVFSCALTERIDAGRPGPVTLPGLDPERRYRVRRVALASTPMHVRATPPWWDEELVLTGRLLETVGVQAPGFQPDTAVLWEVEAVEG